MSRPIRARLVLCAAAMRPARDALIEMASVEMMDEVWAVNLRGVLVASQYGARIMARSGGGSIVNLASDLAAYITGQVIGVDGGMVV